MSDSDPNSNKDSPSNSRQKPNKSVRWTGQDYFSYAGGSGNQENRARSTPQISSNRAAQDSDTESSDSSDSEDEEADDYGSHRARVRAATRANTWFNRLREADNDDSMEHLNNSYTEDDDNDDYDDDDYNEHTSAFRNNGSPRPRASHTSNTSRPSSIPSIQVSHHDVNPYQHILDIGTHTSAGLGPGGRESNPDGDNDPLDAEYRERRNRLLASVGHHSQPSSPQLAPLDPLNSEAIPLKPLNQHPSVLPFDYDQEDDDPGLHSTEGHITESPKILDPNSEASEAEALRQKIQHNQTERNHRFGQVMAARHRADSHGGSIHHTHTRSSSHGSHTGSHTGSHAGSHIGSFIGSHIGSHDGSHSNSHHQSTSDQSLDSNSMTSQERKQKLDESEELRQLEEAARMEAEEHAKNLVKAHLSSNLLKPNSRNDGYVPNHGFLQKAGSLDEDIPLDDDDDSGVDGDNSKSKNDGGSKSDTTKDNTRDGSTSSSDTLQAEKDGGASKDQDSSDSGSDSEDERRGISLRGDPDYIPPPKQVKEGVLGSLLRLYAGQEDDAKSTNSTISPGPSPSTTPISTPLNSPPLPPSSDHPSEYSMSLGEDKLGTPGAASGKHWKRPGYFRTHSSEDALGRETKGRPKWYKRPSSSHTPSLSHLASSGLAAAGGAATSAANVAHYPHGAPFHRRGVKPSQLGNDIMDAAGKIEKKGYDEFAALREKEARKKAKKAQQQKRDKEKALKKARLAEQARITVHIADVLQRQRFLLRLGRALMLFGAPSHRLEEYLKSTARVLEIDAQVLYIPGCILVSFGDATTHTSETKLIRAAQGLNLAKLHSTHLIYKEVVHDLMSLEEASSHIDHLLRSNNVYPWWLVVLFYGTACACCGMFAYDAFWRDIPIIFLLGGFVGFLQYWVQPKSDLYANVFEVTSSIFVSFAGRALGSITDGQDYVFCFAAIVQASLALILPGYIILVGALELQTKNLVAGSVRMFYANIYSLFLSFGITLGSAIFGWCYRGAVTQTTCKHTLNPLWKILWVPAATLFMALVNQAGYRQLPVMVLIGSAGYTVQYFVERQVNAAAFTSAIGAFTMGVVGNLYSRVGHGLAFAAMLPGIFVLVPSGVAAQGSLVAGVKVATEIVNSSKANSTSAKSADNSAQTISDLGNSMTQVAVGIAVGLFAATLVVYPLGLTKKRSGLFTF